MGKALNLNPADNNYLTSSNRYQQLTINSEQLSINTDNVTAGISPTISTFGDGRVYLNGSVVVSGTPSDNYELATLPKWCKPTADRFFRVAAFAESGSPVNAIVSVSAGGDSIESVTVTNNGSGYTGVPTASITGPGSGAILDVLMGVDTATMVAPGHGYEPSDTITFSGGTPDTDAIVTVDTTRITSIEPSAAGTGYVPTNVLTLVGGTASTDASVTVDTTKVVSATVAAGGSGGSDGTQTVTGTTGTGTKFQASVTVTGGEITAVLSITVGGSYTENPTNLTNEPVTGASLSDAALSVVMGVDTISIQNGGSYTVNGGPTFTSSGGDGTGATFGTVVYGVNTVTPTTRGAYSELPTNPISQGSSSGTGSEATFNATWRVQQVTVEQGGSGYTNGSAISFSGGGGSGAAATLTLETVENRILLSGSAPSVGDQIYLDAIEFPVEYYSGQ